MTSASKGWAVLARARFRSTAAISPSSASSLEVRGRIEEHACDIGHSLNHDTVIPRTVYGSSSCLIVRLLNLHAVFRPLLPTFQQLLPKTNAPHPAPPLPTHGDRGAPLGHSFVGMSGAEILYEMIYVNSMSIISLESQPEVERSFLCSMRSTGEACRSHAFQT
jgi:hypothetical protein